MDTDVVPCNKVSCDGDLPTKGSRPTWEHIWTSPHTLIFQLSQFQSLGAFDVRTFYMMSAYPKNISSLFSQPWRLSAAH